MTISTFGSHPFGITFACWFRSDNSGNWARIIDFGNGQQNNNIIIAMANGISFLVYLENNLIDGCSYQLPGSYNDNIWRHLSWVLTTDGNTGFGTWSIYINGLMIQQLQRMRYANTVFRSNNYVGKSNWGNDSYFNGAISDFRMYNRVLSSAEIAALYAGKPKPTSFPTVVPIALPTTSPSSRPTFVQDTAVFVSEYFSFSGDNSYLFSSLKVALNSTFTISAWISTNSRHPASIVSLGRSPSSLSSTSGGEFVLEINKDGNLHFWDYSPTTGLGFSVIGGKVTNYAGDSYNNQKL